MVLFGERISILQVVSKFFRKGVSMRIQNYNTCQYKPTFAMRIAEPTTYSTVVFDEMSKFIEKYGSKFPDNTVIKEVVQGRVRRFPLTVIDDGSNVIRLGATDSEIIDSLKRLRSKFDVSV